MSDSISVTSHNSYGSRLGNSLKGIVGGIILVIVSIYLLAWNENNYVQQKTALKEGASIVNEVSANEIDSSFDGKEVHLYGETASDAEELKDITFGITTNDLKLKRTVEMYQWYEESNESCSDNFGGSEDCTTTYNYYKKRTDEHINSSNFHDSSNHSNPSNWEFDTIEKEKHPISLGAFTLTQTFTSLLTDYKILELNNQEVNIPQQYKKSDGESSENFHINDNYIYIGSNPSEPNIGDLKISFSTIKTGTISVVGKQINNELTSYTTSNGRSIALLEQGNISAEDMFLHAQQANNQFTWIIRLIGLLLMFCGFAAMFKFIETLAKVIPLLSNIIGVGTSIIALGLTLVVGFLTIGIAWLVARPLIGICCFVVAIAGVVLLAKGKKAKKENNPEINNSVQPEIKEPEIAKE